MSDEQDTPKRRPNNLTKQRERSRLTLVEVSQLTGYSVSTISRQENGVIDLDARAIAVYAKLYKVPAHFLFYDE